MTNSEVSSDPPGKPPSDIEQPDKAASDEEQPGKPPSDRNLKVRLRARLQLIGGALASIAAVGAIAGGLVGYWTVWKTLRTHVFPESQKTQKQATARPDIAPRLSLVVLPFANLNNDVEQDYFADGITTNLTTDLAQMPETFVIGRGTAFTYKNKQVDLKTLGKDLGIRSAVQGAVQRAGDRVRMNVSLSELSTGRDVWSDGFNGDRTNLTALQEQVTARLARSLNVELIQAESRRSQMDRPTNVNAKAEGRFGKQDFACLPDEDVYRCPSGQLLPYHFTNIEHGMMLRGYWSTAACRGCAIESQCTPSKERRITRWEHAHVVEEVQRRLDSNAMRTRRETIEHPLRHDQSPYGCDPLRDEAPTECRR